MIVGCNEVAPDIAGIVAGPRTGPRGMARRNSADARPRDFGRGPGRGYAHRDRAELVPGRPLDGYADSSAGAWLSRRAFGRSFGWTGRKQWRRDCSRLARSSDRSLPPWRSRRCHRSREPGHRAKRWKDRHRGRGRRRGVRGPVAADRHPGWRRSNRGGEVLSSARFGAGDHRCRVHEDHCGDAADRSCACVAESGRHRRFRRRRHHRYCPRAPTPRRRPAATVVLARSAIEEGRRGRRILPITSSDRKRSA